MKTYLAYKNEIRGFKDVAETVKTMEKIAASSIHFLRQEVAGFDAYARFVGDMLARLLVFYGGNGSPLLDTRNPGKRALLVLTADRGLVDGLWHALINACLERKSQYDKVIIVGEKGAGYAREEELPVEKSFASPDGLDEAALAEITDYLFDGFKRGLFSSVDILYPRFVSLVEQEAAFVRFLPFAFSAAEIDGRSNPEGLPIFESSKRSMFDWLLERHIEIFFHRIAGEAKLSEFSARTVAMERATEKTNDLIGQLTVEFHKERKRNLTQKQLESFIASKKI